MLSTTFQPESYRLASHHGLSEATLAELADLEISIQLAYDDDALVEIEIIPEREVGEDTIKVARSFILEDFIRTMKLPIAAVEDTSRFVRRSAPYELLELASVPEASGVVPLASGSDWARRLEPSEFAAALRPPVGVETGWFTRTDDSLPPLDDYLPPPRRAPSKALLVAGAVALGLLAVGLGVGIAMIAL